jgi:hypothetical protein
MRVLTSWAAVAVLGVFATSLFAADDLKAPEPDKNATKKDDAKDAKKDDAKDKKPEDKKADDKKDEKKDWIRVGTRKVELVSVDESKKTIKIKVTSEIRTVNQNEAAALQTAQADYARAVARRDAQGAAQAMQNIANHERNLVKVEYKTQETEVAALDDVKVRIPEPPVTFDDDGKIKKLTAEEKRKLKGDPTLPGYPGEISNLHGGQIVVLTLMRKRDAKPPTPTAPTPGGGKPPEIDLTGDYAPHVSMIEIVRDSSSK